MSNYKHILVAVDFSSSADRVLNKASELASRDDARLSLIHVVEYMPPIESVYDPLSVPNWELNEEDLAEKSKKSLQALCDKHQLGNTIHTVVIGTPKHEISQFAKDNNCDLVVMGSHGRHGLSLLLGSTANAVLHEMPCDILTVKIDDQ